MLHLEQLLRRWSCSRSRYSTPRTRSTSTKLSSAWHWWLESPSALTPLTFTLRSCSLFPRLHRSPSLTAASWSWNILLRLVLTKQKVPGRSYLFVCYPFWLQAVRHKQLIWKHYWLVSWIQTHTEILICLPFFSCEVSLSSCAFHDLTVVFPIILCDSPVSTHPRLVLISWMDSKVSNEMTTCCNFSLRRVMRYFSGFLHHAHLTRDDLFH